MSDIWTDKAKSMPFGIIGDNNCAINYAAGCSWKCASTHGHPACKCSPTRKSPLWPFMPYDGHFMVLTFCSCDCVYYHLCSYAYYTLTWCNPQFYPRRTGRGLHPLCWWVGLCLIKASLFGQTTFLFLGGQMLSASPSWFPQNVFVILVCQSSVIDWCNYHLCRI